MDADDPRHGSYAGAIQHYFDKQETCRPCKDAAAAYRRNQRARQYLARGPLTVPSLGTLRRIRALCALGYHMSEMEKAIGRKYGYVSQLKRYPYVYRATAAAIADLYDRWSGTVPESTPLRSRQRKIAEARRWAPPLAWDDIDDPDEIPAGSYQPRKRLHGPDGGYLPMSAEDVDEATVVRILSGDWRLGCTPADKAAVVARWAGTLNDLGRLTGWKPERYVEARSA
jgi:hypothetical protein